MAVAQSPTHRAQVPHSEPPRRRCPRRERDAIDFLRLIAELSMREVHVGVCPEPGKETGAYLEIHAIAPRGPAGLRGPLVSVVEQLARQIGSPERNRQRASGPVMAHADLSAERTRDNGRGAWSSNDIARVVGVKAIADVAEQRGPFRNLNGDVRLWTEQRFPPDTGRLSAEPIGDAEAEGITPHAKLQAYSRGELHVLTDPYVRILLRDTIVQARAQAHAIALGEEANIDEIGADTRTRGQRSGKPHCRRDTENRAPVQLLDPIAVDA